MTEIKIDQGRCKGCDLCLNLCPKKVFQETKETGKQGFKIRKPIAVDKCSECGLCQYFCPEGAIILNNECLIDEFWGKAQKLKESAVAQNQARGGWERTKTHFPGRHFVSGNIVCVWAAIDAGCRFFAGYPITPANEQSFEMERLMPETGGIFIQMENEDASIIALCGASLAGNKAMTATSGPGFSRMQENLSFALTNELPMVIVNVQRTGPSTGRPTGTGAGEIREARWGSHGGTEHIVLYPSTVQEIYDYTIKAFNLSEEFRIPVILMLEASNAHLYEGIEIPEEIDVFDRIYRPGAPFFGPGGDAPSLSTPKYGEGEILKVSGLTHNCHGVPCPDDCQIHEEMVAYQRNKIVSRAEGLTDVEEYFLDDADIMIVVCGHTARSVRKAIMDARNKGIKVGMLKLNILYPFPEEKIREWSQKVRRVDVVEMNQGQLFYLVQGSSLSPVISLPQADGESIKPTRILTYLEKMGEEHFRDWQPILVPTIYNPLAWRREKQKVDEKDFSPETIFCQGCGLGILRNCLLKAAEETGIDIQKILVVSGIGCTSRLPNHLPFDSANTTHGYPVSFATGAKLSQPDLKIIVISGDGDLFDIGLGPSLHGIRRNIPMVVICFNNFNFGMTGGQIASTTPLGAKTSTTPQGSKAKPFNLVKLALSAGVELAARCPISKPVVLKKLIKKAILFKGFAFIEVVSPCLTYYARRNKLGSAGEIQKKLNQVFISKTELKKFSRAEIEERFISNFPFRKGMSQKITSEELLQLIYGSFSSLAEYINLIPEEDKK